MSNNSHDNVYITRKGLHLHRSFWLFNTIFISIVFLHHIQENFRSKTNQEKIADGQDLIVRDFALGNKCLSDCWMAYREGLF